MPVVFANPPGFLALLGLPLVLLIHFLQREVRREPCTTLFLLDSLQKESAAGHRWERLRQSVPFWLQLLCVLLLTWLLVEPRWIRAGSVQPVAFVLDSSASMGAFAGVARRQLEDKARSLSHSAARTEFLLLDSAHPAPALYRGEDPAALAASLTGWLPSRSHHDFTPALRVARNAVGRQGLAVLLTDHPAGPLPFGARLLAVGSPQSNAGFAGVRVRDSGQGPVWEALVCNHAPVALTRQFHFQAGGQVSVPQDLALAPREIRTLSGAFPDGASSLVLHLTPDAFPLDDVLPVLAPKKRSLTISPAVSARSASLADSFLPALAPAEPWTDSSPGPDLVVHGYDPLKPTFPAGSALVFVDRTPRLSPPKAGLIVAADHPLVENLRWDALILRSDLGIPFLPHDTALLWLDAQPIVWLRHSPGKPGASPAQLVFSFDLLSSNAPRLPAFVLLLHRFAEQLRQGKTTLEHRLAETHQVIELPPRHELAKFSASFTAWDGRELPLALPSHRFELPAEPGFASLQFAGGPCLRLASHFADTREADLSQASSADELAGILPAQALRFSQAGILTPLWALLLAAILLASWAWQGRMRRTKD